MALVALVTLVEELMVVVHDDKEERKDERKESKRYV